MLLLTRFTPNNIFNSHENWLLFIKDNVNQTYADIACFKKSLFNLPSGAVGKEFIKELTFWLSQVNFAGSNMNSVALKCFMILPTLLLQKPHAKSKTREHVECMKRRLQLWKCVDGNGFYELIREVNAIQKKLRSKSVRKHVFNAEKTFSKLIMQGKISAAM